MAGSVETRPATSCDVHITEDAKAACLKHKTLLCFQCISDKTCGRSEGCIVKDISKLTDDDAAFLCVLIRKEFERKEKLIDDHDKNVLQNKTALEQEINKTCEELIQRVNQMKHRTLQSLEEQSNTIILKNRQDKDELLIFKLSSALAFDQSLTDELIHSSEFSRKVKGIMNNLNINHADKKGTVVFRFDRDKEVKHFLEGSSKELGKVVFIEENNFIGIVGVNKPDTLDIKEESGNAKETIHLNENSSICDQLSTKFKENTDEKKTPLPPKEKKLVSLEVRKEKPELPPRENIVNTGDTSVSGENNEKRECKDQSLKENKDEPFMVIGDQMITEFKENTDEMKPALPPKPKKLASLEKENEKPELPPRDNMLNIRNTSVSGKNNGKCESKDQSPEERKDESFIKTVSEKSKPKGKSDSENDVKITDTLDNETLPEQRQVASSVSKQKEMVFVDDSSSVLLKSLINKSINVTGLSHMGTPYMFSQLVNLEGGKVGMFSPSQNIVAIVTFSNALAVEFNVKEKAIRMAKSGPEMFSLLLQNGQCIVKYNVNGKEIRETERIRVKKHISDITGFDTEIASKMFAISSPVKVWWIDEKGKITTKVYADATDTVSSDICTIYQFTEKCVYSVNASHRTLKCINIDTKKAIWKKKIDDRLGTFKGVCQYKNTLCVACKEEIVQFSAADGRPIMRYDIRDMKINALGICVIDDVIVVSTEPEAKLAFVSW